MTSNSNQILEKIEQRVSYLLKTDRPKEDLENMYRLQREHTPHLSQNEAQEFVIQGIIETHSDHELDHLWYLFKNASEKDSTQAA